VAVFGSEANIPGLPGSDQVNLFLPGFLHAHASALFKATNSQILTHVRAEHQKHAGATLPLFVGPNGAAGGSVLSSAILHAIPVGRRDELLKVNTLTGDQVVYLESFIEAYGAFMGTHAAEGYQTQEISRLKTKFIEISIVASKLLQDIRDVIPNASAPGAVKAILDQLIVYRSQILDDVKGGSSSSSSSRASRKRGRGGGGDEDDGEPKSGRFAGKFAVRSFATVAEDLKRMKPEFSTFVWLVQHNIIVPLNALIFRPYVQIRVGTMMLVKPGPQTACTGTQNAGVTISTMADGRQVKINYHAENVSFVRHAKNIAIIPAVKSYGELKGGGVEYFTTSNADIQSVQEGNPTKDCYAILTPYTHKAHPIIDMLGEFNSQACRAADRKALGHYPTALYYRLMHGWQESPINPLFLQNDLNELRGYNTTVCMASHTRIVPDSAGWSGKMKSEDVAGVDAFGDLFTMRSMKPIHNLGHYDQLTGAVPRQAMFGANP
jgi:hypothetical protein